MEVVCASSDQVDPEDTSKLHKEVAQILMAPNPATLPSSIPVASWEVPYNQLTEEEKT